MSLDLSKDAPVPSQDLIAATSQAEFVKNVVAWKRSLSPKLSFATLARRCGFSSKSFIRDVSLGKKSLSTVSAQKLAKGLDLPPLLQDFLLAILEREKASTPAQMQKCEQRIAQVRNRALGGVGRAPQYDVRNEAFALSWRAVYAALGTPERGATVAEIKRRTRLTTPEVREVLAVLEKNGLVRVQGEAYVAQNSHLVIARLSQDQTSFPTFFRHSLKSLQKVSQEDFGSQENLLLASTFSVSEKNLPVIRERIHHAILKIVDEIEEAEGDRVKTLLTGFF